MSEVTAQKYYSPLRLFWIALAVCLASLICAVDSFIVSSSITAISGELGVRREIGVWLITLFTIAHVMTIPIAGRLGLAFGIRRIFLCGLVLFMIGSLMCGLANHWNFLLFARMVQGAGAGFTTPLALTIIVSHFPPNRKGVAIGFWNLCVFISPSLGPWIGGLLSNEYWHWMFLPNVPLGLIALILTLLFVDKGKKGTGNVGGDYLGYILLIIFLGAIQVAIDRGQVDDWFRSPKIIALLVVTVISFTFLLIQERYASSPVFPYYLYRNHSFLAASLVMALAIGIFFASFTIETLWLLEVLAYPPVSVGYVMLPLGILPPLIYPFLGLLVRRSDPRLFVFMGITLFAVTFFALSRINLETTFAHLALIRCLQGIAFPLITVPNALVAYAGAGPEELPYRVSLYAFTRNLCVALLVSLTSTLWIHRTAFYTTRLAARSHAAGVEFLSLYERFIPYAYSNHQAIALVNETLVNQAKTLGLADIYYLFGWIYLTSLGLVLLYDKPQIVPAPTLKP